MVSAKGQEIEIIFFQNLKSKRGRIGTNCLEKIYCKMKLIPLEKTVANNIPFSPHFNLRDKIVKNKRALRLIISAIETLSILKFF